jgi:hypothetical protein
LALLGRYDRRGDRLEEMEMEMGEIQIQIEEEE